MLAGHYGISKAYADSVQGGIMTKEQKIEFGMEIIAGMKAHVYKGSIEDGREMVQENMEHERVSKAVYDQALWIADIALAKIEQLTTG